VASRNAIRPSRRSAPSADDCDRKFILNSFVTVTPEENGTKLKTDGCYRDFFVVPHDLGARFPACA
jgi:hypothetical protein